MMARRSVALALLSLLLILQPRSCSSWQVSRPGLARPGSRASSTHDDHVDDIAIAAIETPSFSSPSSSSLRRSILLRQLAPSLLAVVATTLSSEIADAAPLPSNAPPNLDYVTTPTGLQYADVRPGVESASSPPPTDGQYVSIDYVMSTTGARYGSKIYSTVDAGAPYRWTLGDGSTMPGLEEAVRGMRPGGIRRVIIPPGLAYRSTSASISEFFFPHCRSVFVVRSPPLPHDADTASSRHVFFCSPRRGVEERQGPGTDTPGVGGDGGIPAIQEHLLQPGPRLSARPCYGREAVRKEVVGTGHSPFPPPRWVSFVRDSNHPSLFVHVLVLYQKKRSKYHRRCPGSVNYIRHELCPGTKGSVHGMQNGCQSLRRRKEFNFLTQLGSSFRWGS